MRSDGAEARAVGIPIHSMVGRRIVPSDRRSERRMKPSIDINVEQSCLPLFTSGGKRSRSDVLESSRAVHFGGLGNASHSALLFRRVDDNTGKLATLPFGSDVGACSVECVPIAVGTVGLCVCVTFSMSVLQICRMV